jgi:hypothetical protein
VVVGGAPIGTTSFQESHAKAYFKTLRHRLKAMAQLQEVGKSQMAMVLLSICQSGAAIHYIRCTPSSITAAPAAKYDKDVRRTREKLCGNYREFCSTERVERAHMLAELPSYGWSRPHADMHAGPFRLAFIAGFKAALALPQFAAKSGALATEIQEAHTMGEGVMGGAEAVARTREADEEFERTQKRISREPERHMVWPGTGRAASGPRRQ